MLLSKNLKMGFIGCALLAIAVLALPASAERRVQNADAQRQVADRLDEFKSTAFKLRHQADILQSHRNSALSWQSHATQLQAVRDHVNQLGKSLSALDEMKVHATDSQKMAIEHARPHLVAIAQNTTRAIELLNENRGSVRFSDYGEATSDIYDHADTLHTKLDAILDFENAKSRMNALEL